MSHFLARLVERARGTAARVEPVVAPRFAPGPITEIATEIEAPTPVGSRETQPGPRNEASGHRIVRQKIEPPRAEETGREETAAASEQMLVPQGTLVPHPPTSIVRRIAPGNVAIPSAANGSRPMESVREARATRPGSASPATNRAAVARIGDPGRPGADRAACRGAIQPNESNNEPPIVRVTIGRIEVRAETPAPVAPRKTLSPSKPKLTLGAYLRSRREGTR